MNVYTSFLLHCSGYVVTSSCLAHSVTLLLLCCGFVNFSYIHIYTYVLILAFHLYLMLCVLWLLLARSLHYLCFWLMSYFRDTPSVIFADTARLCPHSHSFFIDICTSLYSCHIHGYYMSMTPPIIFP